jgi:hypothetical protein
MSKNNTTRVKLINALIEYAGDEFESKGDLIKLASMSDDELLDNVISTLDYYHRQVNDES